MKGKTFPHPVKRGSVTIKVYRKKERGEIRFAFAHYEDGRRKFRTFAEEKDAIDEAGKIADRLARANHEGAKLTGADRAGLVGAEAKLAECPGVTLLEAASVYAAAYKVLGGDRIIEAARFLAAHSNEGQAELTVTDAVERYKVAKGKMSKRYRDDIRLMLGAFKEAFVCRLAAVTSDQIEAYINAKSFGPVARNNHLRVIKAFFSHARERKWLSPSLPTAADAVSAEDVPEEKVKIFTPTQTAELLAAAEEDFQPWLALMFFGGLRNAEIDRLEWQHVDFTAGTIHVPGAHGKVKKWREHVMEPNLRAWLAPCRGRTGPIYPPGRQFDAITRTAEAAKVEWLRNAPRHSFGSYMMGKLKDPGRVAVLMGNSPGQVMKNYRAPVAPAAVKAYWNIKPGTPANVVQMPKGRRAA